MKKQKPISDFELRVIAFYHENEYEILLDAMTDYCEKMGVDYEELPYVLQLTPAIKSRIEKEAREKNLLETKEGTQNVFEF